MMNDISHTYVEIIAPTVEEAVEKGLRDLNLPREAVEVEILDKGRRGLLGVVGGRQVRVRLIVRNEGQPASELPVVTGDLEDTSEVTFEKTDEDYDAPETLNEEDEEDTAAMAQEMLSMLLEHMHIRASVKSDYVDKPVDSERDENAGGTRRIVSLNITGQDLSILIGRQAETLHALQFITSLMVNKRAGRAVPLSVDVEGYRERRRRQLLQMAQRMAEQAIRTGRRQVLEPMSSEDRRTIHLELRNHPNVFTESIGDEPRRKVTIVPR